jgi:hypothetical protein
MEVPTSAVLENEVDVVLRSVYGKELDNVGMFMVPHNGYLGVQILPKLAIKFRKLYGLDRHDLAGATRMMGFVNTCEGALPEAGCDDVFADHLSPFLRALSGRHFPMVK